VPATALINGSSPVTYGLKYGTVNSDTGAAGIVVNETDIVFDVQRYAPGYTLKSYSSRTDAFLLLPPFWTPNSTLVLGGDTTILFYYIGGVYQLQWSDDPLFATVNTSLEGGFYGSKYIVSEIVCDTKYQFCVNDGHDCSSPGPTSHIIEWIASKTTSTTGVWANIGYLVGILTRRPTHHGRLGGLRSHRRHRNTCAGSIPADGFRTYHRRKGAQPANTCRSCHDSVQLPFGGWTPGQGSALVPAQLCGSVIIETTSAVSILLTPYLIFLDLTLVIVIVSYAQLFGASRLPVWRECADLWSLLYVGQLHREVVEQLGGMLGRPHGAKNWPDLKSGQVGLSVEERGW
jgi:hypothetical protein